MNLELIEIIKKVKEQITDDSDMVWMHYDNAKQLRDELDVNVQKLTLGDTSSLVELKNLFLPTAALQEHAISNGLSDDYLKLAAKFDNLYSTIKNRS
jgi:hypothetical protein